MNDKNQWPADVNREYAEGDGLTAADFQRDQWPISNVKITMPGDDLPPQIALCYGCDLPANTPQTNLYEEDGTPIPDPTGMVLASVRFDLYEADTGFQLDTDLRANHTDGQVLGFRTSGGPFWDRVRAGSTVDVILKATPRFFYLTADGAAHLDYADTPDGYFSGETAESDPITLNISENDDISIAT